MRILERFMREKNEEPTEFPHQNEEVFQEDPVNSSIDNVEDYGIMIDFEKLNIFSIERAPYYDADGNISSHNTVIGYFVGDESREWNISISRAAHDQLVNAYKQYKPNGTFAYVKEE